MANPTNHITIILVMNLNRICHAGCRGRNWLNGNQALRQSLQQSYANSRKTRYNVGWRFSQFIKTKLTAIIYQQRKNQIQCRMAFWSIH